MEVTIVVPGRKEDERTFNLNNRPNRVFALFDERTDTLRGIRLNWFPDENASAPFNYITTDNGETFRHVSNFFGSQGVVMRIGDEETSPETMTALRGLLVTWRECLAKEHQ